MVRYSSNSNYTDFVRRKEVTISSSLLQLTGRMKYETGRTVLNVADSSDSSLSYISNYFTTHRTRITSRYNERIIESYLEKLREEIYAKATDQKAKEESKATRDKP